MESKISISVIKSPSTSNKSTPNNQNTQVNNMSAASSNKKSEERKKPELAGYSDYDKAASGPIKKLSMTPPDSASKKETKRLSASSVPPSSSPLQSKVAFASPAQELHAIHKPLASGAYEVKTPANDSNIARSPPSPAHLAQQFLSKPLDDGVHERKQAHISPSPRRDYFEAKKRTPSPVKRFLPNMPGTVAATSPSIQKDYKTLDEQREKLVDEGKYLEAEEIYRQMVSLKLSEEARRKENVRVAKMEDLLSVETAHLEELKAFNDQWDDELKSFEDRVSESVRELTQRQQQILAEFVKEMQLEVDEQTSSRVHVPSAKLLEMRKAEKALAKQHEYKQAQVLKQLGDELHKQEIREKTERIKAMYAGREDLLKDKFKQELAIVNQRNSQSRDALKEGRRQQLAILTQKYQNQKQELENATQKATAIISKRIDQIVASPPAKSVLQGTPKTQTTTKSTANLSDGLGKDYRKTLRGEI